MGRKPGPVRPWTAGEIAQLRELAGKVSGEEIARRLGRTVSSVEAQARARGLSLRVWRP